MTEESEYFLQMSDCHNAINALTHLVEISPWDSKLRQKRSDCYLEVGDSVHAISDLRFTTKLNMDDTEGLYRSAKVTSRRMRVTSKVKII